MAGSGTTQIINGQTYTMYSPAWYDAMHAEAQRSATAQGTASGSELAAASKAAGVPLVGTVPSVSGAAGGTGSGFPTVQMPPSLSGLSAAASGAAGSAGGGSAPAGSAGSAGTGYAHLAPIDTSAAEAASFGKAKDQVGQEASGALTGLRSALGGRGLLGGGLEERGTAAAATGAAGQLGDVTRQQAVTRADLAQKNAETNFTGDITQRGQDFQREEAANTLGGENTRAAFSGAIAQRGQDIQAINAQKALEIEQAQLANQQRSTALAGLEAALKVTSPSGMLY